MYQSDQKFQFLKRTSQFVLSVSVFSFFVWYSSGFSILPHESFNAYFSTFLFSMFTHSLERKYMFLICNVILAFLAKTSPFASPPSISSFDVEFQSSNDVSQTMAPENELEQGKNQEHYCEEEEEELEQEKEQDHYDEEEEEKEEVSEAEEQEDGKMEGKKHEDEEEKAEEVQEAHASTTMVTNEEIANTDELNRKVEEFIRKMKEEIRIEARRQLIAV